MYVCEQLARCRYLIAEQLQVELATT